MMEYRVLLLETLLNLYHSDRLLTQVITGSWDKTLKCWNPRGASAQERALVGTYAQLERVYSISLVGNRVVVATMCYALSSVEGRVAMEFFELTEVGQSKKYLKCHRKSEAGRDIVYPVNAVAFHPVFIIYLQYPQYPTSFAALSFSKDARFLTLTSNYTYEEGDIP
nr:hypothetical protein [Tanacetum cinerariifolium]